MNITMRILFTFFLLIASTSLSAAHEQTAPARMGRACTPEEIGDGAIDFSMVSPEIVGGLEALQASILYPEFDRRRGIEGTVIIRFIVGLDGRACDTEVVRSVNVGLDPAALTAVEEARYIVGRQNGQPVAVRMTVPVRFSLQ